MSSLNETVRPRTSISGEEARTATLAAVAGMLFAGLALEVTGRDLGVEAFGRAVGAGYNVGWLALLALSAAFSLLFVEFLSRTVNSFVQHVIATSSQQELLQKLLVPLLRRSALTVTAVNLGLGYGLLVGVAFYGVLLPAWLKFVVGVPAPVPNVDVVGVLVWVIYGGLLGAVYGQAMER